MASPAVNIQSVSYQYGDRTALDDVSFSVASSSLFGVLGPNGSGKTTLFRILATLIPPRAGTARVFGLDTTRDAHAVRQRLGLVFQSPALDEKLTVRENLRFHGALYGLSGPSLHDRIDALLERFGVLDRADDAVDTLSGGLQRRADLARGLLHRPDVLLLDEPTTGLDPTARRTFWQTLGRLRSTEGTTMIVATHLMEEAERCDRVAILDEGLLVATGTPHELTRALGEETIWLATDDPAALRDRIEAQFGLDAAVLDGMVHLAPDDAPQLLSALYDAFGGTIDSATVRTPTLDDVFMVRTGHRPTDALQAVDE
jgi:ABC-2 type transport system ATP-binding protein